MEHEVYVPFSAAAVRGVLAEPDRVAGCLPGLQPGPESAFRQARLRVRVGGSTITYRGELRLSEHGEGFAVEAEGAEARGGGTVRLSLTVRPRPAGEPPGGEGTTLAFSGTVDATGRLATFDPAQRDAAARRLLDRFAESLTAELARPERPSPPAAGIGAPDDNQPAIPGIPAPESGEGAEAEAGFRHGVPELDIPSPPLDPRAELGDAGLAEAGLGEEGLADEFPEDLAGRFPESVDEGLAEDLARGGVPADPEADVARRTMIGRSAEEVDHAPPRGRYAPKPAPGRAPTTTATLRWAAPVAALAVASAVVVGRRVLRRRR